MSKEAYIERIVDIADLLNDNLNALGAKGNKPLYRADLLFKLALAYYVQNNTAEAIKHLREAKRVPRKVQKDDLFLEILSYWETVFSDGSIFTERVGQMEDIQIVLFEIMFHYSAMLFHTIPRPYLDALSCAATGRIYCSRRMMKAMDEKKGTIHLPFNYDNEKELYFFDLSGKKLYYLGADAGKARNIFYSVNMIEQAPHSPHLYFTDEFFVRPGDVFCDVGAAEANVALGVAETAAELHIFEGNADWTKALEATFAPFKEKTYIVNKMVSDVTDGDFISLDDYFGEKRVDFLKLDVEGFEMNVLRGAEKLLAANPGIRLCVCTYHQGRDAAEIKEFLEKRGFKTEFSEGFMIFPFGEDYYVGSDPLYPYFRQGLIRAKREE
jgi:hypothetical protein